MKPPRFCPPGFCPVGLCHGETGERLRGQPMCETHLGKLSPPMRQRLGYAEQDGELSKVLREAVTEAQANDKRWPNYAVIHHGRVEPFEKWFPAYERAGSLGYGVRMASRRTWTKAARWPTAILPRS